MVLADYILLALLAFSALAGYRKGLIRSVGGLVGLVASIVIASRYFDDLAEWGAGYVGLDDNINFAKMLAFVLLLFAVAQIVEIVFALLEKTYKTVAVLPFMRLSNRLLGALLNALVGAAFLGTIIYFSGKFPFGSVVEKFFADSEVAPILLRISAMVMPLIPDAIQKIQGLI